VRGEEASGEPTPRGRRGPPEAVKAVPSPWLPAQGRQVLPLLLRVTPAFGPVSPEAILRESEGLHPGPAAGAEGILPGSGGEGGREQEGGAGGDRGEDDEDQLREGVV